jgi:putative aldouronate transport system permease protein
MGLLVLLVLYPLWYILVYSFNDPQDAVRGGLFLWPRHFSLFNYKVILGNPATYQGFLITFLRTVLGTLTSVFFTAMVAYGLSKRHLVARPVFLTIGTITLVFSAGMIPSYFVVQSLGLLDNFLVFIIPGLFSFYNALIFMTFFRGLPASIEESAQIDGANEMLIFLKLIIPLSMPVIATIMLFNGVGAYNDYMTNVLYISKPELNVIQYELFRIIQANSAQALTRHMPASMQMARKISPDSLKYAAMIITSLPIMIVYPFLQKYFVKGVLIGSVKG